MPRITFTSSKKKSQVMTYYQSLVTLSLASIHTTLLYVAAYVINTCVLLVHPCSLPGRLMPFRVVVYPMTNFYLMPGFVYAFQSQTPEAQPSCKMGSISSPAFGVFLQVTRITWTPQLFTRTYAMFFIYIQ